MGVHTFYLLISHPLSNGIRTDCIVQYHDLYQYEPSIGTLFASSGIVPCPLPRQLQTTWISADIDLGNWNPEYQTCHDTVHLDIVPHIQQKWQSKRVIQEQNSLHCPNQRV